MPAPSFRPARSIRQAVKRGVYLALNAPRKGFWLLAGRRRFVCLGRHLCVTPDTWVPTGHMFPLPKTACNERVVRYTDYVQIRALTCELQDMNHPPTVVEVGASTGAYAVILGSLIQVKGGRMLAIEPDPGAFKTLKRNIEMNRLEPTVCCEQVAVSDKSGTMGFRCAGSQGQLTDLNAENGAVTVTTTTLKELLTRHGIEQIDLLIIDVEGAELPVLRGFPWGKVEVSKTFCEMHPREWRDFGYSSQDMTRFLADHGLVCLDMFFRILVSFSDEDDPSNYIGPTLLLPGKGEATLPG